MPSSTKPKLTLVEQKPETHINVLLYGPPKTGKTVGAATAPGPLLYLNAEAPNATRFAHTRREFAEASVEGLETLVAATEETGKYETVVLDPIGEVYRLVLEGLSGRALSPAIQQYGDTGTHVERFCRYLCEQPLNAVFVCHELPVKDEESGHFEKLPFTGTNNPAFGQKLMAMVDVIGYTGVVKEGDKEPEYVAQLFNGGGRRGGDRFGVLGASRSIDLTEWRDLAAAAMKPKQESGSSRGTKQEGAAA